MIRRVLFIMFVASCCLCSVAEDPAPINRQRSTLFEVLIPDSSSIVMLGNSLTNGCEWHELLDMPNVLNRGISGDTTKDINARLESVIQGRPAKIFLLSGVNDISHGLSADSVAKDIITLVDRILREAPVSQLYVQSILPINNSFGRYKRMIGKEQVISEVNTLVAIACRERGVPFIDIHNLMTDAAGNLRVELTNDGLHLLGSAYIIWKQAIMPYLKD